MEWFPNIGFCMLQWIFSSHHQTFDCFQTVMVENSHFNATRMHKWSMELNWIYKWICQKSISTWPFQTSQMFFYYWKLKVLRFCNESVIRSRNPCQILFLLNFCSCHLHCDFMFLNNGSFFKWGWISWMAPIKHQLKMIFFIN